jgi:hypothetical protein
MKKSHLGVISNKKLLDDSFTPEKNRSSKGRKQAPTADDYINPEVVNPGQEYN